MIKKEGEEKKGKYRMTGIAQIHKKKSVSEEMKPF